MFGKIIVPVMLAILGSALTYIYFQEVRMSAMEIEVANLREVTTNNKEEARAFLYVLGSIQAGVNENTRLIQGGGDE